MASLVSQQTVAAVAAAAALTAAELGAPSHVLAAAVAAAVHSCWRWTVPASDKIVSLLECDAIAELEGSLLQKGFVKQGREDTDCGSSEPELEEPVEKCPSGAAAPSAAAAFCALERRVARLEGLQDRDGLDVWLAEGKDREASAPFSQSLSATFQVHLEQALLTAQETVIARGGALSEAQPVPCAPFVALDRPLSGCPGAVSVAGPGRPSTRLDLAEADPALAGFDVQLPLSSPAGGLSAVKPEKRSPSPADSAPESVALPQGLLTVGPSDAEVSDTDVECLATHCRDLQTVVLGVAKICEDGVEGLAVQRCDLMPGEHHDRSGLSRDDLDAAELPRPPESLLSSGDGRLCMNERL